MTDISADEIKTAAQRGYSRGYSRGYAAGKRRGYSDGVRDAGGSIIPPHVQRHDDMMIRTLPSVLANCDNWKLGGKRIDSAEGYVTLTRVFVDNMIATGPKP